MKKVLSDYVYFCTDKGVQYNGESLEVLKTMPDESINCVITSPPYWGLRDYQTGIWLGGDPECNHSRKTSNKINSVTCESMPTNSNHEKEGWIGGICGKCGAVSIDKQLGLEKTFTEYINKLIAIFNEVKRVLKKDGTCWVNLGDTFGGNNSRGSNGGRCGFGSEREGIYSRGEDKCLCQIPSRFAIAMTDNGWILRNEIIWHKPNCMPSSVTDRFTVDFEKIFFFVKSKKYYFNQQFDDLKFSNAKGMKFGGNKGCPDNPTYSGNVYDASKLDGRNKRCVWSITTKPFKDSHFAVFPPELVETPLKAGCPKDGVVMDIFSGSGTVGLMAEKLGYKYILNELKKEYCEMSKRRIEIESNQCKIF